MIISNKYEMINLELIEEKYVSFSSYSSNSLVKSSNHIFKVVLEVQYQDGYTDLCVLSLWWAGDLGGWGVEAINGQESFERLLLKPL